MKKRDSYTKSEGWRTTGKEGHEKEERSSVARSWGKGKKKMKRLQKGICTLEDGDRKEEVLLLLCSSSRRTRTPFYFFLVTSPNSIFEISIARGILELTPRQLFSRLVPCSHVQYGGGSCLQDKDTKLKEHQPKNKLVQHLLVNFPSKTPPIPSPTKSLSINTHCRLLFLNFGIKV